MAADPVASDREDTGIADLYLLVVRSSKPALNCPETMVPIKLLGLPAMMLLLTCRKRNYGLRVFRNVDPTKTTETDRAKPAAWTSSGTGRIPCVAALEWLAHAQHLSVPVRM